MSGADCTPSREPRSVAASFYSCLGEIIKSVVNVQSLCAVDFLPFMCVYDITFGSG